MSKLLVIAVALLPLLAVCEEEILDRSNEEILFDDYENKLTRGITPYGSWDCPWYLGDNGCADGEYTCDCPAGGKAKFSIGCCYHFPKCGRMCHHHDCQRYKRCNTCKSKVSSSDMRACRTCKDGYIYESGLCDRDENECARNNGGCQHNCNNIYGSYYCTCRAGHTLKPDRHNCNRMSCGSIATTQNTKVTATDNWLVHSWAKFEAVDSSMTLDGPEVVECIPSGGGVRWISERPAIIDQCNFVPISSRKQCGTGSVSATKCQQLGCCYKPNDVASGSPACYISPHNTYLRYGGISPVSSEANGFKQYGNYSTDSCIHKCQWADKSRCKSFGYKRVGGIGGTHNVEFNTCYMLPKSIAQYRAEGKIVSNDEYSIYEGLDFGSNAIHDLPEDSGIAKQLLGCYLDNELARDLPHHILRSTTHMTPSMCTNLCREQRYKYAGVQNGADCFCGNEFYRKYGESETCNSPCSGDSTVMCGGTKSNSIYSVAWTDHYEGCYVDKAGSRDLPFFVWGKEAGRSAAECMAECSRRDYEYAGLQGGGICYCGNTFGRYGAANESQCNANCHGYSRQNCGGSTYNAVYKTMTVASFSSPGRSPYRLYDENNNLAGVSTAIFTMFPSLQSVLSKRLILHSDTHVLTPSDDVCGADCYKPCGDIYQETRISNKGEDVTLRFFYINLSDLDTYVGTAAKRVYVHAQTVIIDRDVDLRYSLYLRTRTLVIDRSRSYYINVPSDAKPFDLDVDAQKFFDPEPDTLHQKQSIMCARILLDTLKAQDTTTAFSILTDIAQTQSQIRETRGVVSMARDIVVDIAGLSRDNVRFVPFYTKSHIKLILDNYAEKIEIYEKQLEKLVRDAKTKEEILDFVEGLEDIYTETNIAEAKTQFTAATDAVEKSNATYHRFRKDYEESRDALQDAKKIFEAGLKEKKNWSLAHFFIEAIASIAKATLGTYEYDKETAEEDIDGIKVNIQELFAIMHELSNTIKQIDSLSEVCDKIIEELEFLENEFESASYYDEVEMAVQLQVNIVKWRNLKNYGEAMLSEDDVASVRGCSEYHRHLLDVCNWGEALTRSMVERSEMIREAMKKRMLLDLKKEQKKRIDDHINKYRDNLFKGELLINEIVEQSYDIRLDLNEALLTFCQAYFYENMFECKRGYKPSFGGSLEDLLLKINAAKRDDLLVGSAPSTLRRYITVTDTDTDPNCNDAAKCPINYLRKNRVFYVTVPTNHSQLADMDAYKVSELILTFNGAKRTSENHYLKIQIESSGDFRGRADGKVHNFMTRALSLAFEYNIDTKHITVHADVYQPYRNIIQHITPFTTWVMRVSNLRSSDIDLSDVTSVKIQFNGSGVDNETWKRLAREAQQ